MRHRTLAAVLALFSNGGRVERFEPYGSGHIHDTFSVRYNEGEGNRAHIILQRINTKIFKNPVAVMENIRRTIGTRRGTGGSSGADYLRHTLFQPLFPDLWAIRSEL